MRQFEELLLLNPAPGSSAGFYYELDVPGDCRVPEAKALFRAGFCENPVRDCGKDYSTRAFFEPSALRKPLVVRSRISGDRYGGPEHRKVKKMLIDRKIPLIQREILPMVVSGNDVIWIPGFRPAREYEVRDSSQNPVFIEFSSGTP
jgi:tRNA(Ile)-lysidine synthase